jgi:hypothetical protein
MPQSNTRLALFLLLFVLASGPSLGPPQTTEPEKRRVQVDSPSAIQFLSDSDSGYRLIEHLQRIAYEDDPRAFRWTGDPKQVDLFVQLLERFDRRLFLPEDQPDKAGDARSIFVKHRESFLANLRQTVPTRYEDPLSVCILNTVVGRLDKKLKESSPTWKSPRIGTLPLGTMNAKAIPPSKDEPYIVLVHSGLFSFCHEMVKIAVATVPISGKDGQIAFDLSEEGFDGGPRKNVELQKRLAMALEDFANDRRIGGPDIEFRVHDLAITQMVEAIEVFAVAHEFGHVFFNHDNSKRLSFSLHGPQGEKTTIRFADRDWAQEAAADVFGFMMLDLLIDDERRDVEKNKTIDFTEYKRLGPLFFFELAVIAEEAKYIYVNGAAPPTLSDEARAKTVEVLTEVFKQELDRLDAADQPPSHPQSAFKPWENPETKTVIVGSHPPNWARAVLMRAQWEASLPKSMSAEARDLTLLGQRMIRNLRTLWDDLKPRWVTVAKKLRKTKPSP